MNRRSSSSSTGTRTSDSDEDAPSRGGDRRPPARHRGLARGATPVPGAGRRPGIHPPAPEGRGGVPRRPPPPDAPGFARPAAGAQRAHRPGRGAGRRAGRPGCRGVRRPPRAFSVSVALIRATNSPAPAGGADPDRRAAPRRRGASQEALQLHRLHAAGRGGSPGTRGRGGLLEPRWELPDRLPPRGGKRRRGRAPSPSRPRPGEAGREGARDGAGRGPDLDQPEDAGTVRPRRRPRGGGLGRPLPRPVGRTRRPRPRHRRAPLMPEFVCRVGTPDGRMATRTVDGAERRGHPHGAGAAGSPALLGTPLPGEAHRFPVLEPRPAGRLLPAERPREDPRVPRLQPGARGASQGGSAGRLGSRHSPGAPGEPALSEDPPGRAGAARRRDGPLRRVPFPRRRLSAPLRHLAQGGGALGGGREGPPPFPELPEDPRAGEAEGDRGARLSGRPHRTFHRPDPHPDDVRHPPVHGVLLGLRRRNARPHRGRRRDGHLHAQAPPRDRPRYGGGRFPLQPLAADRPGDPYRARPPAEAPDPRRRSPRVLSFAVRPLPGDPRRRGDAARDGPGDLDRLRREPDGLRRRRLGRAEGAAGGRALEEPRGDGPVHLARRRDDQGGRGDGRPGGHADERLGLLRRGDRSEPPDDHQPDRAGHPDRHGGRHRYDPAVRIPSDVHDPLQHQGLRR